jgi:hypothetical protein
VPLIRKAIIIDSQRRAEGKPAVGAAHKHHVGRRSPGRLHTGQYINVIVSGTAGVVNLKEHHSTKAYSIKAALNEAATKADRSISVKSRCLTPDLRVA